MQNSRHFILEFNENLVGLYSIDRLNHSKTSIMLIVRSNLKSNHEIPVIISHRLQVIQKV